MYMYIVHTDNVEVNAIRGLTDQEWYNSLEDALVSHVMADPLHHLKSLDL